jgi:uroporphyrinogen III methyltransferase/synthase
VTISNEQPLTGRTIVITRAREQASAFSVELERFGARVVLCPTIEIVEPENYERLDQAIEDIYGYDWLIFTSVNGVDYFLRRFDKLGHVRSDLDFLKVCAIGDATAERLGAAQVHVDLVPEQFKAEGVFTALKQYVGDLSGLTFLIPRAAVARDYLPKALEAAGARADVVPAYRTVSPDSSERRRVEAMIAGGGIDCVTFTSSSTVSNFVKLFDNNDLGSLLNGVTVACIGDITSRTAAEHGLRTDILPREYTVPALARAIAEYYSSHP